MKTTDELNLTEFYPKDLEIISVENLETEIRIHMKSRSKSYKCPKCGTELNKYHSTHHRRVQDLPILGKRTMLDINMHDYYCTNDDCEVGSIVETYDGFLDYCSRNAERLIDFVTILALETSCESAARILKASNIKISGDTIIRMLMRRYSDQEKPVCGNAIGIDDFAFKKRNTYGTIIVGEETHKTVAVLNGRDGENLKNWLKQNKHVKTVTRDRASAYAKAVEEVLPDCMQIADRFHLHQNLLEAVKSVVNGTVPVEIKIPSDYGKAQESEKNSQTNACEGKKISEGVDNFPNYREKSVQLYEAIHKYADAGYSKRKIARILHCSRNTVIKYLSGDFESLCRKDFKSGLDKYYDYIVKELTAGKSRMDVLNNLVQKGYKGGKTAAYDYMNNIIKRLQIQVSLYKSTSADAIKKRSELQKYDHISRSGIFRFLWMNAELSEAHRSYIMERYPKIRELRRCILEFRDIFGKKSMPRLYLFIEKYMNCEMKEIQTFAKGLMRDVEAVENSVASPLSNGFVEGTNSKLKMVKRTMYGRCSKELLEAKLIYDPYAKY